MSNSISFEEHIGKIEAQMGMTVQDFHKKLNELITPEYLNKAEENRTFLDQWITDGLPITTVKKESRIELELQDGEYFVPCFVPDEPVRNEMPIFWFYSNKDNLVSVTSFGKKGTKKVYWLRPKESGDNRGCQKWKHPVTNRIKTIKAYSLGALIFNKENVFGRAKDLLEQFGSYAYGLKGDLFNVQSHHEEGTTLHPELIYDHDNIGTVDVSAHNLVDKIRDTEKKIRLSDSAQEKEQLKVELMREFSSVASEEAPGQIVVMATGETYYPDGSYKNSNGCNAYRIVEDPLEIFTKDQWENLVKSVRYMIH